MSWKWFSKEAGQIKSTRAGKAVDDARRSVKKPSKDEVAAQRNKKNSGGKK